MGAHRKPKTKPTAFAAVVTAAIVVPTGTAAAASYGAFGPAKGDTNGLSAAGPLAANANAAATSAAKSTVHRITVTPIPMPTTSASRDLPKPSPRPTPPKSAPTSPPSSPTPSPSKPATATPPKPASPPTPTPTPPPAPSPTTQSTPYKNVTLASLEPTGLYGPQQYLTLTSDQWANAKTIVAVTEQRGMPLYAAVIATATAMQESNLINLTYATNYDSLGLFQQRPSMGWGTAAQVTDPAYATNTFLAALATYAPNYESQSLWAAAQAVQRSGLPTAYAQWQAQAATIVQTIANGSA